MFSKKSQTKFSQKCSWTEIDENDINILIPMNIINSFINNRRKYLYNNKN